MICDFPTCKSNALPGKLHCLGHNKHFGTPQVKVPKDMPKESKKQIDIKKELKKLYPMYLKKNPVCNIKSPECTGEATCVNHTKGRGPDQVLDTKTWEPSCARCNSYIEDKHKWAEERGHKKSRHKKTQNS